MLNTTIHVRVYSDNNNNNNLSRSFNKRKHNNRVGVTFWPINQPVETDIPSY